MRTKEARIETLEGENEALRAKVAALAEMAFRGSEGKGSSKPDPDDDEEQAGQGEGEADTEGAGPGEPDDPRRRGQRRGGPGHGRRRYEDLKKKVVIHELDEDQRRCRTCGRPYRAIEGDEVSTEIEWRVEVYRIEHHRRRYQKSCECEGSAALVVAPVPAKVVPKGLFSAFAIAQVLIEKFALARPLNKIIAGLALQGLDLAPGSVVGVLHKVGELLSPLHDAYLAEARRAKWWNCDETPWACFFDPDTPRVNMERVGPGLPTRRGSSTLGRKEPHTERNRPVPASLAARRSLIHLGMDVHKDSISVGILHPEEESPVV
ncbi:MAG: IS66 family transposase, partial [Acidimicrobiales bacterium]